MDAHEVQVEYSMSHLPQDGSADDGLSISLLRFIDQGQLDPLRQALSGFNHRCRNMLNSMKMGFYLAKRAAKGPLPDRWDDMNRTYAEVERLFDLIQSIYRSMALTLVHQPFRAVVEERERTWLAAFEREGLTLTIEPPEREGAGQFDAMRLSSAFDGFVAWRASRLRRGGSAVLSWKTTGRSFHVDWKESPGTTSEAEVASPCSPHVALAATTRSLALPLLARVVAEHHGRLSWTPGPHARASISWPLLVASPAGVAGEGLVAATHASLAPTLG